MNVDIIASSVSDNFFYVVTDATGQAVLIDPIDGARAVEFVRARELRPRFVVNTHFHHDHVGGNDTVLTAFPDAQLLAGANDAERIEAQQARPVDRRLNGGDTVSVGEVDLQVFDTPGHTPGHISLLGGTHLFSGDTLFVGGAGNCKFGGDPGVLFSTFDDVLSQMSGQVVFYPGHDYSARNLEFILSIEPDNAQAAELLERARGVDGTDEIFLTTLGDERAYSPFFRYDDSALADRLEAEHSDIFAQEQQRSQSRQEAVFRTVRELRNRW